MVLFRLCKSRSSSSLVCSMKRFRRHGLSFGVDLVRSRLANPQ